MTSTQAATQQYRLDWRYTQDIIDAGFAYGPDRYVVGLPTAPTSGVKVRVGDPTQNQIAVADATHGYRNGDKVVTIWSDTLRETPADCSSDAITPVEADRLTIGGVTWIIKSVHTAVYGWRFVCMVRQSSSTVE